MGMSSYRKLVCHYKKEKKHSASLGLLRVLSVHFYWLTGGSALEGKKRHTQTNTAVVFHHTRENNKKVEGCPSRLYKKVIPASKEQK